MIFIPFSQVKKVIPAWHVLGTPHLRRIYDYLQAANMKTILNPLDSTAAEKALLQHVVTNSPLQV
jgi:hypothetical protein